MGRLIKPKIDRIFTTKVVQLTQDLSLRSKCILFTVLNNPCPNCIYDSAINASSGKYRTGGPKPFTGKVCPICAGKGKIENIKQLQIPANVKWGTKKMGENFLPEPEGFVPMEHARIKAEVKYYDLLYNATYFMIDGLRCSRVNFPHKRGLQSYVITEMLVKLDK